MCDKEKDSFIGRKVKIVWEDNGKTSIRIGILNESYEEFIVVNNGKKIEMINKNRILRLEVIR